MVWLSCPLYFIYFCNMRNWIIMLRVYSHHQTKRARIRRHRYNEMYEAAHTLKTMFFRLLVWCNTSFPAASSRGSSRKCNLIGWNPSLPFVQSKSVHRQTNLQDHKSQRDDFHKAQGFRGMLITGFIAQCKNAVCFPFWVYIVLHCVILCLLWNTE